MMNNTKYIVAVEIGSSKIKGALGEIDENGALLVKGIEEEHLHPNFVRYGQVQNPKEVANELNRIITKLNNRVAPGRIVAVYVAVGGRSLKTTPARLESTLPGLSEVTPEIVEQLLGRARAISPDRQLLDVEPVDYQVDGKSQGINPIGVMGRELAAKVNLISIRTRLLTNLTLAVKEKLDLRINGYVVRPLALADLVLTDDERRLGVMLVDFGAETTTVTIYKKGALQYLATIPLGSRHITRDLTALHYTEERAEEMKRSVGNCHPDTKKNSADGITEIDTTEINNLVRARAGEIAANISAHIGYADFTKADIPSGIVLVGGGAMLQGFTELLATDSGLTVRRGSTPPSVRIVGSKIRPGEDLDVIAILNALTEEDTKMCVEFPTPEPQEEPAAEARVTLSDPAPKAKPTGEYGWDDEVDDDEEVERISAKTRGGFFNRLKKAFKDSVAPLDEADEE